MCGITGFYNSDRDFTAHKDTLEEMVATLSHRGPDEKGFYCEGNIGLGQSRLSIIDLAGGTQPIYNEDRSICVVFNGEIYNYVELKPELEKRGHRFYTHSDTEVIVHLYEDYGNDFLTHLNGNFAIALWDTKKQRLLLARDRVGIRPLFYTHRNGTVIFGSEMKSIFAYPGVEPRIDIAGVEQVFTLWANVPPRTVFTDIKELAPGHFLTISPEGVATHPYWKLTFPDEKDMEQKPFAHYVAGIQDRIHEAVKIRLRADVPVASYLSGGIDSSIIASLVKKHHNNELITFSVAFSDKGFDERSYQMNMVDYLQTDHRIVEADYGAIGHAFTDVIRYAEKPTIRTAPAPLLILSKLVRDNNIKVVLTGEGADEVFGGYNIFKEDKIRRFWARQPESKLRPLLLSAIYPYVNRKGQAFWQAFFKKGLTDIHNPYYSHLIRWNNTGQIKRFFSKDILSQFNPQEHVFDALDTYINPDIARWHPFCRAQYLEMTVFMSGYLLSTQGDRMMMGNSVEGRFPFLDHTLIEYAATIPPEYKCRLLNEKYILKEAFKEYVPQEIVQRAKQPYRAPISTCFLHNDNTGADLLTEHKLNEFGYFNGSGVSRFFDRLRKAPGGSVSARDDMAVSAITSMQLLHHHFIR